ncbi:MAG: ATP-binding cassette domain-containing protein, partial [Pseudomonadota bacterium]
MSDLVLDVRDRLGAFELDVQCTLPMTGVTALLGHSGAGKSSLLAALAGIRRPAHAAIRMGDVTLADTDRGQWLPPEQRGLGCVLQRPCLFPHLSVQANCEYGARRRALPLVAQDVGRVMRWLDLADLLERRPHGLSGGEQQRVALARALLSGPALLLLDEPLAAVDARRRNDVLPYLEQVCSDAGVPVIYVSHAIDDVARLADRIVVMHEGRVRQVGDVHAVLSRGVRDVGFDGVNVLDGVVVDADPDAPRMRVGHAELTVSMRAPAA